MLLVVILGLVLLICLWFNGDYQTRTKFIMTGIYLLCCASVVLSPIVFIISETLLTIILGGMTFGVDFLNQNVG